MPSTPGGYTKRFGFGGGYDHRWAGAFQKATAASGDDPNADVFSSSFTATSVRGHSFVYDSLIRNHSTMTGEKVEQHAFIYDAEVQS